MLRSGDLTIQILKVVFNIVDNERRFHYQESVKGVQAKRAARAALTALALLCAMGAAALSAHAEEPHDAGADGDSARGDAPSDDGDAASDDGDAASDDEPALQLYDVSVFGDAASKRRVAGPAHKIDEEELERFEDDNVHRILPRVPGVYVRGEDGYGLRPNIGMRGANSDRSSKVNLLEDGVLLGPAPYSAPAAYFFPLMTRMTGVEVFKGPSAIRYGPNTIGGTINFLTRPIPYQHKLGFDLAAGSELYGKAHGHYGYGAEHWGVLVEGVRLRSSGFKELDSSAASSLGDNTGFDKMEVMAKARVNTDPGGALYNEGNLKVTYSREVSNETYLGLTDADFAENPLRRYAASALDRMKYERIAFSLSHGLVYQSDDRTVLSLRTTAYRHDFQRAWRKLNAFDGAIPIADVLAEPTGGQRGVLYEVLTGAADSTTARETLLIGTNDRTFVSQGIQTAAAWRLPDLGPLEQRLQLGLRVHNDSIERLHTEDPHRMRSGRPERTADPTRVNADNLGSAVAVAGYAVDELVLGPVLVTPGVRFEHIETHFENRLSGETLEGVQRVFLPGVGLVYQPLPSLALLGGVHQGFSPVTPGQPGEVKPEVATNIELGARFDSELLDAELTRFVSLYDNLSGICTFSSGCAEDNVDTQFNAGKARITGVEASANVTVPTPIDLRIPVGVTYTFTRTLLLESFTSDNPQLGQVQAGDELPYVPMHQAAATVGLLSEEWGGLSFGLTYMDGMRESAGQGEPLPGSETDSFVVIDASATLKLTPELAVYGKVENLLDNEYIVSRRPYGARPGRPRFIFGGVKIEIDR